jgi:DNA-binding LacI/PurR family transcriptional regulator/DNA-binding transcriptional regulator YhcF (GntR family)
LIVNYFKFHFNLLLLMEVSNLKPLIDKHLRPRERVLAYVKSSFLDKANHHRRRMPTAQLLANQLGVGVSTVQKVYQQLIDEGKLEASPGRGTYIKQATETTRIGICFGIISDRATEVWQSRISGAIIQASGNSPMPAEIIPIHPGKNTGGEDTIVNTLQRLTGVIFFPQPSLPRLVGLAEKASVPWVTLHPLQPQETANFVSPDYIESCRLLGMAGIRAGRRRVALVQAHPSGFSASNFLRSAGLLAAIGKHLGDTVKLRIFDAETASVEVGRAAAASLFRKDGFKPDLVFCMGDFLAHGFLGWLRDNSIDCPNTVSVVSGTGLLHNPDPFPAMTSMRQELEQMGEALLRLIYQRLDSGASVPGIYIPSHFVGGATTVAEENEILFSKHATQKNLT